MTGKSRDEDAAKAAAPREERLKQALKANLARRKAQARARSDSDTGSDGAGTDKEQG
jgi:hypothetical protein